MPETVSDFIEITTPSGIVERVSVTGPRMVAGRLEACDIHLDSQTVSRKHAEISRDPFNRWWVRDLGSRNGTIVNGRIVDEAVVGPADVIQIEDFELQVKPADSIKPRPSESSVNLNLSDPGGGVRSFHDLGVPKVDAEHISAISEFGRELLLNDSPSERQHLLCKLMVAAQFHGQTAMIIRVTREQGDDIRPEVLCDPAIREADANLPAQDPYVSRTLLKAVLRSGEPAIASNAESGAGADGQGIELSMAANVQTVSAAAVPLRVEDAFLDVFYITFPAQFGTAEWLALAKLASEQYQQCEVAWAARKQATEQATIENELNKARTIQLNLIPDTVNIDGIDAAIGFEPCLWVGGDYCDVLDIGDGRSLMIVADVCGKGLQAALITVSLHAFAHTNAGPGVSLKALTEKLNDYLVKALPDNSFVSAILMTYAPDTGALEIANCGHPPALLCTDGGSFSELPSGTNMPLGCFAPMEYAIETATVAPGDSLLAYTDGLNEMYLDDSQSEQLDVAGVGRCLETVCKQVTGQNATARVDAMNAELDRVQDGRTPDDDRSFLILRRDA